MLLFIIFKSFGPFGSMVSARLIISHGKCLAMVYDFTLSYISYVVYL